MKKTLSIICIVFFVLTAKSQHNVILIIADDLGSDYCGFYENHLDTVAMPNVRRLLARGVRFRKAWSNPLCSPTRAGMLTGRYSFRTGVGDAIGGSNSAVLDVNETTIPKLLNIYSPNGIEKANIGKWHLQLPTPVSNYNNPALMGYDHYEGCFSGGVNSYTNWTKVKNGVASTVTNYATTETVNNAISWINTQPTTKPFFLWLAFNAPHTPYHLPPAGMYSNTSLSGTDADIAANPKKYFKAMVEAMDYQIGRLFDTLISKNKWQNTDIIFIGDNGDEATVAQNTGGAKGSIYQEGVSVPFIISGPSVVNPNRTSDALVNTQDLFATILELFGYTNWQSQISSTKPVDSKSILPILNNQSTTIRPWAFTEVFKSPTVSGDGKAMRNLDYKLLKFDNGTEKFFNLTNDPNENTNLLTLPLSFNDVTNYNYLCTNMTTLVGGASYCNSVTTPINTVNLLDNNFTIYPNPVKNKFYVISNNPSVQVSNIIIVDALGRVIQQLSNIQFQIGINTSQFKKGTYYLQFTENKTKHTFSNKFVVY